MTVGRREVVRLVVVSEVAMAGNQQRVKILDECCVSVLGGSR